MAWEARSIRPNKNAKALTLHSVILLFFTIKFNPKLGFKCTNGAFIRDQEVKIYKKRHFVRNFSQICKKVNFGGHIEFLTRHFDQKLIT